MTGTSELSISQEEVVGLGKEIQDRTQGFRRYLPLAVGLCVGLLVLATPLVFLLLPVVMWPDRLQACGAACEGLFLSIAFKLLILLVAIWALFLRPGRASLPRVCVYRAFLTTLTLLLTMSYWLFYGVRILDAQVGFNAWYNMDLINGFKKKLALGSFFTKYFVIHDKHILLEMLAAA